MRNIGILFKNYILCGIGNLRRKNTRAKTIVGFALVALIFLANTALFSWSMLNMAKYLAETGTQAGVLVFGLIITLFMAVIFALQKITGGQKANDTEMLLSMPFKKIEIMIAKALSRLCFNFLIVIMFFLPSVIAYMVYTPFSLTALLGCITVMVLIPLMAVGLSSLVDYLVTVCFSNSKFGNIAKAIFTLFILIGVVVIYEFVVLNPTSPVMMKLVFWIITFNPLVMWPLIVGMVAFFILGNWLNALLLNREGRTMQYKSVAISTKTTTPFKSILKNETNRYFNSPTMMLNTIIGPLGMVALTIWLAVDHAKTMTTFAFAAGLPVEVGFLIIALVYAALTILTYPAAFSISLEGKQLWILRSMPIPAHTILNAKILFNILLISPLSLICSVILQFTLQLSIFNFISLLVIPILANILISYIGVFTNLCFPNLEFESEAAVIKQSMSSFIMMLGGMIVVAGLIGLTFLLIQSIPVILIAVIIIGVLALGTGISMVLCYTIGQRMFNRL
ncbi:MAG: hypothetical protein MJ060_00530 [Clostridia bacterium]|nr:hypothetical protein [Clostridia bacterium]